MLPAQCSSLSCAVHHVTFVHESILQKKKGTFQHSSFLAGGATSAAGRLVVEDGVLKVLICLIYIAFSGAELLMLSLISSRNSEFRQITNTLTHCDDVFYRLFGLTVVTTARLKRTSRNSRASSRTKVSISLTSR